MKKVSRPASRSGPLAMATSGTSVTPSAAERLLRRAQLALPAVDQHQIGPGLIVALVASLLAGQHRRERVVGRQRAGFRRAAA